jgi:2-polyprenyl-6-methoxyphenol hydroxylase-like FAD-dependent oxidoreductase
MTLAIDLTRRGIGVTLAEVRVPGEAPSVRCDHVSARTMETFRRIGLASVVRGAGLPADYPNDVAFRTTATGLEFGRIPIPCSAERYVDCLVDSRIGATWRPIAPADAPAAQSALGSIDEFGSD